MSVWHNAHGLLIPPVVAYFVYQELKQRPHLPAQLERVGIPVPRPAMILQALDAGMHTELLSAASLVLALPGLCAAVARRASARAPSPSRWRSSRFALPIPLALTESIHLALRHVATAGTASVVPMLGIPVFVEGTTLHMAAGALQVADACSGFSTLYAAMAVAFLTAYSTPSADPPHAGAAGRRADRHRLEHAAGRSRWSCSWSGAGRRFSRPSSTRCRA